MGGRQSSTRARPHAYIHTRSIHVAIIDQPDNHHVRYGKIHTLYVFLYIESVIPDSMSKVPYMISHARWLTPCFRFPHGHYRRAINSLLRPYLRFPYDSMAISPFNHLLSPHGYASLPPYAVFNITNIGLDSISQHIIGNSSTVTPLHQLPKFNPNVYSN